MTDETLIWNYLTLNVDDKHPSVFVYCTSYAPRSRENALKRVVEPTISVLSPPINKKLIEKVSEVFLQDKRVRYLKGEISVLPLYANHPINYSYNPMFSRTP